MTEKKTQSSRKKEKSSSQAGRKVASSKKRDLPASSPRNPLAVLVIMALTAALVILINYNIKEKKPSEPPYKKEMQDIAGREPQGEQAGIVAKSGKNEEKREAPLRKEAQKEATKKEMNVQPYNKSEVRVYLVRIDATTGRSRLVAVTRKVQGDAIAGALKELINGPTASEKKRGLLTAVPSDLKIRGIRVKNKIAEIDFNAAIERGASGSVLLDRIDQIVYTATQFPTIDRVIITIDGKRRETLGTDGLSIGGPIERREH